MPFLDMKWEAYRVVLPHRGDSSELRTAYSIESWDIPSYCFDDTPPREGVCGEDLKKKGLDGKITGASRGRGQPAPPMSKSQWAPCMPMTGSSPPAVR